MIGRTSRIVVWPPGSGPAAWVGRRSPGTAGSLRQVPGRAGWRFHHGADGSILEGVGKHGDDEEINTCHVTKL